MFDASHGKLSQRTGSYFSYQPTLKKIIVKTATAIVVNGENYHLI
jgi:hypothetical protein